MHEGLYHLKKLCILVTTPCIPLEKYKSMYNLLSRFSSNVDFDIDNSGIDISYSFLTQLRFRHVFLTIIVSQ